MAKYIIKGKKQLAGELEVKGAKNAALPILCAAILAKGRYHFSNIPELKDVENMLNLLRHLGLKIEKTAPHSYYILNEGVKTLEAPYDLVKAMRASFLVIGPLLGSQKEARVSMPGGCAIGSRPVNFHLQAFEKMGAKIVIDHGFVLANAETLNGTEINFPGVTVTGTENLVMAAVMAKGKTIINNAAREPEVADLCGLLNKMGAKITGIGSDRLEIDGTVELRACDYEIISDRVEAGTFIILSALTGGKIEIKNARLQHLSVFVKKLKEMGVDVAEKNKTIKINVPEKLNSIRVQTEPYPGFPTDLQPQLMVLLSQAEGESAIEETIFENRFMHVQELNRLGARIQVEGHRAVVYGGKKLIGAEVKATDLRAGAALVLAGLIAENTTVINEIEHIERGYEDLAGRLRALGADICLG